MSHSINVIQVDPLFCPHNICRCKASNFFDDLRCVYTILYSAKTKTFADFDIGSNMVFDRFVLLLFFCFVVRLLFVCWCFLFVFFLVFHSFCRPS